MNKIIIINHYSQMRLMTYIRILEVGIYYKKVNFMKNKEKYRIQVD